MLKTIVIGFVLVAITFGIHAYGSTSWIEFLIRRYAGHDGSWRSGKAVWCLTSTGVVLLGMHLLEAFCWALAYMLLPGISQLTGLEQSFYFSIITFTTLGYGDITLDPGWRVLAGVEATNGILLAGWSTALLFTVVQRSWKQTHSAKRKRDATTGQGSKERDSKT